MCRRTTEDRREDLFHGVTLSSPSPPFIHTCGEEKRAGDYRGRNIRTYRVDVDPLLGSTHRKARDCGNYTLWANMSQFVILPRTRTTESAVIMDKRCINQRFRKKILPRAGLWSKVEQNQEIFFFVCVHSFEIEGSTTKPWLVFEGQFVSNYGPETSKAWAQSFYTETFRKQIVQNTT